MTDSSLPSSVAAYAPPAPLEGERGVFADGAIRRRSGFLYRTIDFSQPFVGRLTYSGWWFVQRISVDHQCIWWKISWLTLQREVAFVLPPAADPLQRPCQLRIDFGPGLRIRRFQITVGGQFAYDEIV